MTVAETLPTMTDAEKVKAFDKWAELTTNAVPVTMVVEKSSGWALAAAIAHVIADRKPDLAPWTPEKKERYYVVWAGAAVRYTWDDDDADCRQARDFGNVFRTREEAEAHAKLVRVFNRVFQMRAALGMMELSPWDVAAYFAVGSDTQQWNAIREQLEKEGAL